MKLIAPDYYNEFKCIASECRHSCCIGWEIDIDDEMLEVYKGVEGPFGERLRASVEDTEDGARFILGEDERCPFLNKEGLCDLIVEMGEESLCQICADHPRFRNYLSDRTEIGLGLCCEAAGKLILSRKERTKLVVLEDDGHCEEIWDDEADILALRKRIFAMLQDRTMDVDARLDEMMVFCESQMPRLSAEQIAGVYFQLERLDPAWDKYIGMIASDAPGKALEGEKWETAFEQLAVYFIFRHFIGASEDGDISGRAGFAALGVRIIRRICEVCAFQNENFDIGDLAEIARMYSSETEYSDENMEVLLSLFGDVL